jgi:hypothetical protein
LEKQEKRAAKEVARQISKESKEAYKASSKGHKTCQKTTGTTGSNKQIVALRSKVVCEASQELELVTLVDGDKKVVQGKNRGRLTGVGRKART